MTCVPTVVYTNGTCVDDVHIYKSVCSTYICEGTGTPHPGHEKRYGRVLHARHPSRTVPKVHSLSQPEGN